MNAYFFKMNQAERNNILDQHKKVYDGFVTTYGQQINQPLYVQDYANDKEGLVVNNRGDVKAYTNMRINEMKGDELKYVTPKHEEHTGLDYIADDPNHFIHGTMNGEEVYDLVIDIPDDDEFSEIDVDNVDIDELIDDEEMKDSLQEQLDKTLEMFRRFKKY